MRRAGDRLDAGLVEPAAKVEKFEVWKGGSQEPVQFAPGFLENVGQSSRRGGPNVRLAKAAEERVQRRERPCDRRSGRPFDFFDAGHLNPAAEVERREPGEDGREEAVEVSQGGLRRG